MAIDPITGPILGGVLLGLIVLFGGTIIIRLIRRARARKRRQNDPELAKNAKEGHQVGVAAVAKNDSEKQHEPQQQQGEAVSEDEEKTQATTAEKKDAA